MIGISKMDENPILMHLDSPYHRGPVENATHVGYARSASCGDEVRLYLIVDQGVVTTAGFVASGCMVCQAAASILCEAVESRRIPQLELMTTEIMLELIGVPLTLRRQQCGLLPLIALRQAISVSRSPETSCDR